MPAVGAAEVAVSAQAHPQGGGGVGEGDAACPRLAGHESSSE